MSLLLITLLSIGNAGVFTSPAAIDSLAWHALPQALEYAADNQRPVLLYVQAPWCGPCRHMERDVFPETLPLLDLFALSRLNFDDHDTQIEVGAVTRSPFAWARHFGAEATPAFVFLDSDGTVITRVGGSMDVRSFSLLLAYVGTGAHRHVTFDDYVRRTSQRQ